GTGDREPVPRLGPAPPAEEPGAVRAGRRRLPGPGTLPAPGTAPEQGAAPGPQAASAPPPTSAQGRPPEPKDPGPRPQRGPRRASRPTGSTGAGPPPEWAGRWAPTACRLRPAARC